MPANLRNVTMPGHQAYCLKCGWVGAKWQLLNDASVEAIDHKCADNGPEEPGVV